MRSVRARGAVTVFLLLAAVGAANGESLWSPDFKGYLSGSRGLAVGDSLVVQIDASSSLSFSSSSNDSKNLTLEFTGGQSGNLFSFLPQVRTGGTLTTTGKDSLSLKTQVPVVVTAREPGRQRPGAGNAHRGHPGQERIDHDQRVHPSRPPGPERLHQLLPARQRAAHLHHVPRFRHERAEPRRPADHPSARSRGGACSRGGCNGGSRGSGARHAPAARRHRQGLPRQRRPLPRPPRSRDSRSRMRARSSFSSCT